MLVSPYIRSAAFLSITVGVQSCRLAASNDHDDRSNHPAFAKPHPIVPPLLHRMVMGPEATELFIDASALLLRVTFPSTGGLPGMKFVQYLDYEPTAVCVESEQRFVLAGLRSGGATILKYFIEYNRSDRRVVLSTLGIVESLGGLHLCDISPVALTMGDGYLCLDSIGPSLWWFSQDGAHSIQLLQHDQLRQLQRPPRSIYVDRDSPSLRVVLSSIGPFDHKMSGPRSLAMLIDENRDSIIDDLVIEER